LIDHPRRDRINFSGRRNRILIFHPSERYGVTGTIHLAGQALGTVLAIDDNGLSFLHSEYIIETGLDADGTADTAVWVYFRNFEFFHFILPKK